MFSYLGKILIVVGIIVIVIGIMLWLFGNKLSWFGNLPGDIKIEKENFRFYIPIVTMIIISGFLTLLLWIINKILK